MDTIYTCTYVRTTAGQREVIGDELRLPDAQRQILLLVNGYTPMVDLSERLPLSHTLQVHIQELVSAGLIEEAPRATDRPPHVERDSIEVE